MRGAGREKGVEQEQSCGEKAANHGPGWAWQTRCPNQLPGASKREMPPGIECLAGPGMPALRAQHTAGTRKGCGGDGNELLGAHELHQLINHRCLKSLVRCR